MWCSYSTFQAYGSTFPQTASTKTSRQTHGRVATQSSVVLARGLGVGHSFGYPHSVGSGSVRTSQTGRFDTKRCRGAISRDATLKYCELVFQWPNFPVTAPVASTCPRVMNVTEAPVVP